MQCLLCERFFTQQEIENGKAIQSRHRPKKQQVLIGTIVHEFYISGQYQTPSERRIDERMKGAFVLPPKLLEVEPESIPEPAQEQEQVVDAPQVEVEEFFEN